jgi:hypothetical protein
MKAPQYPRSYSAISGLALALALVTAAPSAHANVFASNVKINGGMTNLAVAQGASLTISYILNEPASAGVTVKILSGAAAVRTITIASGAGTTRGLNTVTWNGKSDSGANAPAGNYSVSIKAASSGYAGWTKTTDDNNPGNYTWESRGIAVDRNTNSPYYGRVFVGNSFDNTASGTLPGDYLGVQKLNADGSAADEGGFSDGGVAWLGGYNGPWKIRVSDDDYVYVEDWTYAGDLYRFDGTISSNSMLHAFAPASDLSQGNFPGICITGKGTNTTLWTADTTYPGSLGISKFPMQPDGTFDPSAPIQVVGVGGSPGFSYYPCAVSVDKAGNIYAVEGRSNQGDPAALAFRFPAYNPTNASTPEFTADWAAGPGNDYNGAQGVAVDPTGTYVAACFWGYYDATAQMDLSGNVKILYATNGAVVTNLDLGISYTNNLTSDPTHHRDTDADWDAVGNLYYLDDWPGCWRAFSPPGANQATTVALPVVQVIASVQPPVTTSIGVSGGQVTLRFTGGSDDPAWAFLLFSAPVVQGPYLPAVGALITGSGGAFQVIVPVNGPRQFYRLARLATIPIHITSLNVAGGTVAINFTSSPSDSPTAFTLLSSTAVNGTYSSAAGASISQVSSGLFQATVLTNGPSQFYQIRK